MAKGQKSEDRDIKCDKVDGGVQFRCAASVLRGEELLRIRFHTVTDRIEAGLLFSAPGEDLSGLRAGVVVRDHA